MTSGGLDHGRIDTSPLFAPIVIKGHTLKNRLVCGADDAHLSNPGWARATETDDSVTTSVSRAGGFGAITTEGIYTDQAFLTGLCLISPG